MPWYVYIAKTRIGYYYTGISPDPTTRIIKHNKGRGSQMGKQQRPFTLVYKSQPFPNKSQARKKEAQIKCWRREKKEKLITGKWV